MTPQPEKPLTCALGEPWIGDHPLCDAEVDRACREFDAAVIAGIYDAQGYTPNERKAQQKKRDKIQRRDAANSGRGEREKRCRPESLDDRIGPVHPGGERPVT